MKTASSSPTWGRLCQGGAYYRPGQHQSPRQRPRRGPVHPGGHGGRLLRLLQGGQLRHLRLLHRIPPPGKRQQNLLHRHPQKAGPHPVGGSPGDDQRPGGGGGHRHLYLLHAALSPSAWWKQTFFPHIPAYFCFRRNSVDRDGLAVVNWSDFKGVVGAPRGRSTFWRRCLSWPGLKR